MKVKVSIIDHDSDMALKHTEIEIPDSGFVNEHVRQSFDDSDYEIIRIENTKRGVCIYVTSRNNSYM